MDHSRLRELVDRPSESLNVEIKRWLDPQQDVGVAKIIKAAFGLRNRNGGFFVLGFDDKTLLPNHTDRPSNVRAAFQVDTIQGIISRYASEPFEIDLGFESRDGHEHVVIGIPVGITAPVVVKRDLFDADKSPLLAVGDVYFRTLNANGTPSIARARPEDWRALLDICFDNREADIGRFLRRHLTGQSAGNILRMIEAARTPPPPTLRERSNELLLDGQRRFERTLAQRTLGKKEKWLLDALSWSVALIADPEKTNVVADSVFLARVMSSNPNFVGWPIWPDSRPSAEANRPKVIDNGWESLIISLGTWNHFEFWRLDPKGKFFLRRALQDDATPQRVKPGMYLDPILVILRVAEALAVGLSLAQGIGWDADTTTLGFAFQWAKISGRRLEPWANPSVIINGGTAHQDQIVTSVELPLDTPTSAIAPFVDEATRPLFALFDGYRIPLAAIETWVQRLLTRTLS